MKKLFLTFLLLLSIGAHGKGIDVFGIGLYDFKLDGSETNQATDVKYERRFDIRKSNKRRFKKFRRT